MKPSRTDHRLESSDDTARLSAAQACDSLPNIEETALRAAFGGPSGDDDDSDERALDITELATAEYPVLRIDETPAPQPATELNGIAQESTLHDATAKQSESVKVTYWLSHLESEVSRLQAKWLSIDAEFKSREARITELHEEIRARETTIARLTAELQTEGDALKAADERLTSKDGEIAALEEDRRARDERIASLSTELADAAVAHKATQEELARAQAETARLDSLLRREQAASAEAAQRNEELLAEQQALRTKLQDLEIYINGRHDRWSELNANLADYKNTLAGMEKTVRARDAVIAAHDEEKARLAARILDLERQCSELAGRRKEREEAYEELEQKLAARLAETEQLKAENAGRAKETELVSQQAVDRQRHIESLERDIEHRDKAVKALTAEVEQSKAAIAELTAAKGKLDKSVGELEAGLAERSQQVQALREDMRTSNDQLRAVQDQLSQRTTELASSQETVNQRLRDMERLTDELHAAQKDAVQVHADLETLGAHAAELGRLRGEAVREIESLKRDLAAQRELVAGLQTELRSKQATADLLERSVDRITDLGASLAALDQRMSGGAGGGREIGNPSPVADFGATLAADDRVAAAAPPAARSDDEDLLPMSLLLPENVDGTVDDIGLPSGIALGRKLLVTLDGRAVEYPLNKKQMTIGRGHDSDIRIASHFVSRVHAKISTNGVATIIEDVGSKNGLLVNSERVRRRVLRDGDVVSLAGELNLRFVDAAH